MKISTLGKVFPKVPMEYEFTPILLCLIVVSFLYLFRKLFFVNRKRYIQQGFPSFKLHWLNFIGHATIVPRGPAYDRLYPMIVYAVQSLEALRVIFNKDGLFVIWILHIPFIALCKAEAVEALLKSSRLTDKAMSYRFLHTWLGDGILTSKGKKWKSRRKLLTPSFHFDILKDFLPIINEKANILNDTLRETTSQEWIDVVKVMTLCSLDIICETTLGTNINAQKQKDSEYVTAIFRVSEVTMKRTFTSSQWIDSLFFRTKIGKQYLKDLDILHSFTRNIIRKKKDALKLNGGLKEHAIKPKRQALMDLLLNYHMIDKDFTEEDIREEVDTFAFEGHDTTAMGLSWALFMIGLYPHVQEKIHEELDMIFGDDDRHVNTEDLKEMKYLECVIKESQRLYPSVSIFGRRISEGFDVGGRHIPKGVECGIFVYGLHRDPDVFSNPEVFDPERFFPENVLGRHPYAYIPFSAGPRNCIGQRFAMMELKVVLSVVLRSFTLQSLDKRDKILPMLELILRPSHPIRMKVVSRNK